MIRRLISDRRGTSLIEFAICLPFLLTLFIGSYQLSDAISAYRKVTQTTRAVADLTSQYSSVNNASLDTILAASQQIMAPYNYNNAKMTITQVKIDASGNATVDWSRGLNVNALTPGAAFTVPTAIKVANTYIIVASTNYTYTPVTASGLIGTIPMQDQIILSPRTSASITNTSQS